MVESNLWQGKTRETPRKTYANSVSSTTKPTVTGSRARELSGGRRTLTVCSDDSRTLKGVEEFLLRLILKKIRLNLIDMTIQLPFVVSIPE